MLDNIAERIEALLPSFIKIREHIHANPELSFQEFKTHEFVISKLKEFGITNYKTVSNTGVVVLIEGKNPSKRIIALRGDMDALPIVEKNDVPYKSKHEGVMHACGHDVHTTCLLATAQLLQETKEDWEGSIKLIFQPGEEKHPGGASLLIKEGVLENPKPQAIFALHVYPHLPYGKLGFKEGQYMASADEIYINIKGKGGHAALPHQCIDPIVIAAQIITSLQTIISRRHNNTTSPSVLSFGKIQGGTVGNVIPDEVKIEGTLRCMDETWRTQAHDLIKTQVVNMAKAMGAEAEIEIPLGYPFLVNHPETTQRARSLAEKCFGTENIVELPLRMAAEDFSFYTHHVPGCFFRLGTAYDNNFSAAVHTPTFDIYPNAIAIGVRALYEIATQF